MSGAVELGAAISLLTTLLGDAYKLNLIIEKARAENRDISDEEWITLDLAQKQAHNDLRASIEKREEDEASGD